MIPPFVSYITFNRLGLTARNLKALLGTHEDFELYIIDSSSKDDTWDFIQSIDDKRIKSKTRLSVNAGPIYAVNLNLSRRKSNQYFITVDSDVYIKTQDWISRFMKVFDTFPEVGLLGAMRGKTYPELYPAVIPKSKNDISYLELKYGHVGEVLGFIHGCCQCLRPELIEEIGYWSEETCWGDAELSPRITNYTHFKVGYMVDTMFDRIIDIDMTQYISCNECQAKEYCKLNRNVETCFDIVSRNYKNESFVEKFKWKYDQTFNELKEGKRTVYCASIHDQKSMEKHLYHMDWALENFNFYIGT